MQASKDYMKENNMLPSISFELNKNTVVKMLKDKKDSVKDKRTGEPVHGVRYLVEQNGEKKTFFTGSYVLIEKLSNCNEGDVVTIRQIKKQGQSGPITSYEVESGAIAQTSNEGSSSEEDKSLEDAANSEASW